MEISDKLNKQYQNVLTCIENAVNSAKDIKDELEELMNVVEEENEEK